MDLEQLTPPERNYTVTTIPAHQPEYAIYVDKIGGVINAENTWVYAWNGSSWGFGQKLLRYWRFSVCQQSDMLSSNYSMAAIGMQQTTSSASVMLFSVNTSTNLVEDSSPIRPKCPWKCTAQPFQRCL